MQSTSSARKLTVPQGIGQDPVFSGAFYRPYEAAISAALPLLCAARAELCSQLGTQSVQAVTFRLKSPASIRDKLKKKGLPASDSAASAALHDVAGMRVVLQSVPAVYRYAELIRAAIPCFGVHDYIASPKESGYRSLHLLLLVPVTLYGERLTVPLELQLRTTAMDIWANLEHELCYKPNPAAENDD